MKFLDALKEQILVLDGAMGSMVQLLKLPDSAYGGEEYAMLSDLLVFSRPDQVRDNIHLEYLKAGANILETNTFGASPLRLQEFDFSKMDLSDFADLPEGLDFLENDYDALTHYFNIRGIELAQDAIEKYKKMDEYDGRPLFVAGSIGPSNWVISSTAANLNKTDFATIKQNFYLQVKAMMQANVDVLLFETQQDMLELKASIAGAHQAAEELGFKVPIMAQVTVDQFNKMQIFNTDMEAAYAAVGGIGIDVFGINCTLGPELMQKVIPALAQMSELPISVVPNAGQPISVNGETVYPLAPEKMGEYMRDYEAENGINIVGGCCGTTPAHIAEITKHLGGKKPKVREVKRRNLISGPQNAFELDASEGLIQIGERLNVRGSKKVRDAVEVEDNIDNDALEEVVNEQNRDLGIDILDVCMDSNIVNTEKVLPKVIYDMTMDFGGAFCIDSFAVDALEVAIDVYPGRPIINSIALEEHSPGVSKIDAIVPLTKHHNPVYIALVTDGDGPALTADKKLELAEKIVAESAKHGVTPDQLMIDINAFPIGAESIEGMNFALESLNSLKPIKAIHPEIMTSIGVGNLTNGLAKKPYMRVVLTSVFLDEGYKRGLDAAIVNPNHFIPVESIDPYDYELGKKVIFDRDMDAFEELETIAESRRGIVKEKKCSYDDMPIEEAICEKIKDGYKEKSEGSFDKDGFTYEYKDAIALSMKDIVDVHQPLDFINDYLMEAMRELGDGFGRGEVSLPHLLKSADVMKHCMNFLEAYMKNMSGESLDGQRTFKGTVVIGTVYQDVHSIGKDLAKTLLENYGYRVIDLGVQVPLEKFIDTAIAENADAIGMSALLVQTSNHMITVQQMCQEKGVDFPLLIGGAPVNSRHAAYVSMYGQDDFAAMNGKVFYCQSGMDGVNIMNTLMDPGKRDGLIADNTKKLEQFYRLAIKQAEAREKHESGLDDRKIDLSDWKAPEGKAIRLADYNVSITDLKQHFDLRTLYGLNWDFGGKKAWAKKGVTEDDLNRMRDEWVQKSDENNWIDPISRFAILPAQSLDENTVAVYNPDDLNEELAQFTFNHVAGRKDRWSVPQYIHSKESGKFDLIGIQISSGGAKTEEVINEMREAGELEDCFLLQGLSDRVAEDMADQAHGAARKLAGVDLSQGCRYSPGYPAMEDMANNKIIFDLLKADEMGISMTDADEFAPTSTTAAFVVFNPDATYQ